MNKDSSFIKSYTTEQTKDAIQESKDVIKFLTDIVCSCPSCLDRARKFNAT